MVNHVIRPTGLWRSIAMLLILFCVAVIFLFSGQDGNTSGSLSVRVTTAILQVVTNKVPDPDSVVFARTHHVVRKIAHMTEYGMLAVSVALLLYTFPLDLWKRYAYAGAACLPTALLDEYLQTYRPGRCGSPVDVCVDMLGACAALLLFSIVMRRLFRKRDSE